MSEAATTTAAPVTAPIVPSTPAAEVVAPIVAPASPVVAPVVAPVSHLDFLPEAYRNDPSFLKYKSADELAKGFKNLEKFIGKKEVVNGIQVPAEGASPEEMNDFYMQLGRPEAADKYALPDDIKFPEGSDLAAEKTLISSIAFDLGLSNKQAESLFKIYSEKTTETFKQTQEQATTAFYSAAEEAFGKDYRSNVELAKKGAKALGGADKLNLEDVSSPLLLKALAMLGKDVGEDNFEKGLSVGKESLLHEAKLLQSSPEYQKGDPQTVAKVVEMYKKAYPN
jgi:hypothetical protein